MTVTTPQHRASLSRRGYADRWYSTAEMARAFGFPPRAVQRRVHDGELVPTYRTPGGLPRWARADFAEQTRSASYRPAPESVPVGDEGMRLWSGTPQVIAQPGRTIAVGILGHELLMDPESARRLIAVLPSAVEVAEAHVPGCTCRELTRDGHIEVIVPLPTCPIHKGATP